VRQLDNIVENFFEKVGIEVGFRELSSDKEIVVTKEQIDIFIPTLESCRKNKKTLFMIAVVMLIVIFILNISLIIYILISNKYGAVVLELINTALLPIILWLNILSKQETFMEHSIIMLKTLDSVDAVVCMKHFYRAYKKI